jgi:hypothetical protein
MPSDTFLLRSSRSLVFVLGYRSVLACDDLFSQSVESSTFLPPMPTPVSFFFSERVVYDGLTLEYYWLDLRPLSQLIVDHSQ